MIFFKSVVVCSLMIFALSHFATAEVDSTFHCYLLFGQSNMAGGCGGSTDPASTIIIDKDCDTSSRIQVMAFRDCNQMSSPCKSLKLNRKHDEWYTAFPPLNNCSEGIGPGDYFSKTLLDSVREDITIGLIPWSFAGQNLGLFQKNNTTYSAPQWAHPYAGKNVYKMMVERCKKAQKVGVIKGILIHQGESNAGDGDGWVAKVKGIFNDLVNDLNLDKNTPFIAGELLYSGCCAGLNKYVNKLPAQLPNAGVASAKGLKKRPNDLWNAHFDCPGMRELGVRYAKEFLKLADQKWVPRRGADITKKHGPGGITLPRIVQRSEQIDIFTFNGKKVLSVKSGSISSVAHKLKSNTIYLLKWRKTGKCNTMVVF